MADTFDKTQAPRFISLLDKRGQKRHKMPM